MGIFKIIALIILIILSIAASLLLLVILLLLIPVKYNVDFSKNENLYCSIKVSWFFNAVKFYYKRDEDGNNISAFKVFWKTISVNNKDSEEDIAKSDIEDKAILPDEIEPIAYDTSKNDNTKKAKHKKTSNKSKKKKERSFSIWDIPDKKAIINETLTFIKKLVNAISPSYFKLNGEIGLDDPATTGFLIGFLSVIIAITNLNIYVEGVFDEKCLKINLKTKGNICFFIIIWLAIMFAIKKPIRRLIKLYIFERKDN